MALTIQEYAELRALRARQHEEDPRSWYKRYLESEDNDYI